MNEIQFQSVVRSDTLDAVAFFPELGDLLVRFKRNNSVYLYKGADETLYKHLVSTPHPWSKFRTVVQSLPYEKVSSGLRTEPLKVKRVEIKAASSAKKPAAVTVKAEEAPQVKRGPGRPRKDGTAAQPRVVVDGKKVRAEEAPKPATKRTRSTTKTTEPAKLTAAQEKAAREEIAARQAAAPVFSN